MTDSNRNPDYKPGNKAAGAIIVAATLALASTIIKP